MRGSWLLYRKAHVVSLLLSQSELGRDGVLQYEEFLDWVFRDPTVATRQYMICRDRSPQRGVTTRRMLYELF